jgi:hypothetical protein
LKYLVAYQPDTDPKAAAEHAKQFRSGITVDGFRYTDSITPDENRTFAMRLIAYGLENGLGPVTDQTTSDEMLFQSLVYDKRVDVVVVFRILERDELGGLTIVWKELSRSDAAKIKFRKNQSPKEFRAI